MNQEKTKKGNVRPVCSRMNVFIEEIPATQTRAARWHILKASLRRRAQGCTSGTTPRIWNTTFSACSKAFFAAVPCNIYNIYYADLDMLSHVVQLYAVAMLYGMVRSPSVLDRARLLLALCLAVP